MIQEELLRELNKLVSDAWYILNFIEITIVDDTSRCNEVLRKEWVRSAEELTGRSVITRKGA